MIKLLECETGGCVRFELGIAAKRFSHTAIFIVEDGRKRFEEASRQNGPVVLRQVLRKLFDFSDRGHEHDYSRLLCGGKPVPSRVNFLQLRTSADFG